MKDWFRRAPKRFTAARIENQLIPDNMWVRCPSCSDLISYVRYRAIGQFQERQPSAGEPLPLLPFKGW